MGITIATSIAPRNIELQRDAIASWKKLGLEAISVNSKEEIESIKDFFPDVKFAEAGRNGRAIAGKPFVYFDDILQVLEASGSEICGIVNSDIYLFGNESMVDFIIKEARDGVIFGSRIDIHALSSLKGEEFFQGFDYFIFSREIAKIYPPTDFCLGVPWWDYWAPLVPVVKGFPVKQLITPFAYHLKHSTRWSSNYFRDYGRNLLHYLRHGDLATYAEGGLSEVMNAHIKSIDITLLAVSLAGYLYQKTGKVVYHTPSRLSSYTNISSREYLTIKEELKYYKNRQKQLITLLTDHITGFHNSLSWRITAPLRWIFERLASADK